MAVKIRMRRMGNNKKPFFRIVATDIRSSNSGSYIEKLGWYDPKEKSANNYELKLDRIDYWKGKGAMISETVQTLIRKSRAASKASA